MLKVYSLSCLICSKLNIEKMEDGTNKQGKGKGKGKGRRGKGKK